MHHLSAEVATEEAPPAATRDFLFIVSSAEKISYLQTCEDFIGLDLCLASDVGRVQNFSYRFIISEDWAVTASMKALQQKVLLDPNDPPAKAHP